MHQDNTTFKGQIAIVTLSIAMQSRGMIVSVALLHSDIALKKFAVNIMLRLQNIRSRVARGHITNITVWQAVYCVGWHAREHFYR